MPDHFSVDSVFCIEVLDESFAGQLSAHRNQIIERSRRVTLRQVDGREYAVRIRDSIAWLFSPYL